MTMATLNRHGLDSPTVGDLQTSLARLVRDDFDAFWRAACASAGVPVAGHLDPVQLRALCDVVVAGGGIAAVGARAVLVRLTTFATLSRI